MKFKNRKASVVAVLLLLMVTQVVFSAMNTVDQRQANVQLADNSQTAAAVDPTFAGFQENPSQETVSQDDVDDFDVVEEIVQADIHVVYQHSIFHGSGRCV